MDEPLPGRCRVRAWRPAVPGIAEVFHARIVDYAYPLHVHDTWTVLIVDDGAIAYDLDRRSCGASLGTVAVLPPGVVHNGKPAPGTAAGFRKRNLYLEPSFLPAALVGPAVDRTTVDDPALRAALAALHDALAAGVGPLDAEARLALIGERIAGHLAPRTAAARRPESPVADRLRDLLDARLTDPLPLREAAALLDRSVPHLVRSFTRRHGLSPHAYVLGRRVEAARTRLLAGARPADVAVELGFHDQAHLTRHFRRHTSTTPGRYARGRP
ncbi:helix-turn-helix domain-containing protein [Pseudonocardia humida]|uniref:helix-turn-helix domain-containing protein n=1 Tax=Pseudonocardia humida TaxID=2800819 RepID=UPI00207D39BB|nr:AraC family transcriptional regulator [Pseudonocardia humida]